MPPRLPSSKIKKRNKRKMAKRRKEKKKEKEKKRRGSKNKEGYCTIVMIDSCHNSYNSPKLVYLCDGIKYTVIIIHKGQQQLKR
jgi:aconitase A